MDISEEGTEPDQKISDTSVEKETVLGDSVSYFENINPAGGQNQVIYTDLNKEGSEVNYLYPHSYRRNTGNYSVPDKSLRKTGA